VLTASQAFFLNLLFRNYLNLVLNKIAFFSFLFLYFYFIYFFFFFFLMFNLFIFLFFFRSDASFA